ncbi:MAG: F0F1 ATP synthase subunit A [Puniceicoccales bacterium]|jgi:F-type H+-transporting ATPase subunit a|nr:F0F1 ATP synthase subunit A [Puniceicoccales bacterium]
MRFFSLFFVFLLTPSLLLAEGAAKAPSLETTPLKLPVTNAILTSWIVAIIFLVCFRLLVGKAKVIPNRAQAVVETIVVSLRDLFEPIVGKKAMPWTFPVLITLFFFILIQNWTGLLPGVGTVGWGEGTSFFSTHVETPLVRPPTSDFNGTIALALFSFGAWLILVLKYAGPKALIHEWFGNKSDRKELPAALYWSFSIIFLCVGVIEVVSVLIRPVTLSVRLFGNVFGGESLLHATSYAVPFYFLELLVGFVQALVFTLLSAVYVGLICNHGDEGEEHAH